MAHSDHDPNPYAPPETDIGFRLPDRQGNAEGLVEPFSVSNVMERAWRLYQKRLGTCIVIVLGVGAIGIGFNLLGNVLLFMYEASKPDPRMSFLAQAVFLVAAYALQFWLTPGQTLALLKLAQDRDTSFNDVFSGGRFFWRYAGAFLLFFLLMIPAAIFGIALFMVGLAATWSVQEPMLKVIGPALGGAAALVLFVFVTLRFYPFPYVLVDRDCGPIEALMGSYEITRGKVGELFALSLFSGMILLAGLLACGVGVIFTAPLSMLVMSCAYVCLTDRGMAEPDLEKPPTAEPDFIDFID